MSFNGSGTFVINSSGQPVVANTVISSTVFNALTADLATGLSTCITKDGQTTPTANIPMGTFKFTNLGNGSAATDSATLGQVQASTTKLVTVAGADTITGTMTPALTAYATGQMFYFVAAGTNTGAATLNIDGLGAKSVTRSGSVALAAGDILTGEVCVVVYDGTRFQLLNPASYTNLGVTGNLTLSGGTANGVAYLNASKVVTSGSALVFDGTNLGIGTASPAQRLHVVGGNYRQNDATNSYGFELQNGTGTSRLVTISGGSAFGIQTGGNAKDYLNIDGNGNVTAGDNNLTTTSTNGFLYVPTCAGVPTGTPTAKTGYAPIVINTTNNKLYFYSGGAWRDAGP